MEAVQLGVLSLISEVGFRSVTGNEPSTFGEFFVLFNQIFMKYNIQACVGLSFAKGAKINEYFHEINKNTFKQ